MDVSNKVKREVDLTLYCTFPRYEVDVWSLALDVPKSAMTDTVRLG